MGIIKQQSLKASLVTYCGVLIGILNVFIVFPFFLNKEQIGLIKSLEAIALIVVPFIYIGFPYAVNKFFPVFRTNNHERLKSGMTYMFIVITLNSLTVSVLFFILREQIISYFNEKSPLLSKYVLLSIPVFLCISWLSIFISISSSNLRIVAPRVIERVLIRIIQAVIVLLFYFNILSEKGMVWSIGFGYLIPTILMFIYVKSHNMLEFDPKYFVPNNFIHNEEKHYLGLLTLSTIGDSFISNIGVVIIGSLLGLDYAAVFFIAYYMGYILEVPATNFSLILKPVLAESLAKGDRNNIKKLYKKSSLIQTIISGFLFVLLNANINEIFTIMPNGSNFAEGKWVVIIISLSFVIKNIAGCSTDILIMSKFYRLSVVVTVIMAILTFLLFILLTNYFGFMGAAYASVSSILLNSFLVTGLVYKLFKILPSDKQTIHLITIIFVLFSISLFLPSLSNPYYSIAYKSIVLTGIYLPVIILFKISDDFNNQLKNIFKL